MLKDDTAAGVV